MKNLIILALFTLSCASCEKSDFNIDDPDVEQFVQQLKDGSYDKYELGENGENLWAIMPNFKKEHIPLLLHFAEDSTLVYPCIHFPTNPVSSIPPFRTDDNKASIMIGEYLLWCAEGIIENKTFASLTPILRNQNSSEDFRLSGKEILEVRDIYQNWWEEKEHSTNSNILPLDGTLYYWQ